MTKKILKGTLLDDQVELTVEDLSRACAVSREWVFELVEEGVIDPIGTSRKRMQFRSECLGRVRTAHRLQRDLDVNLAGVALALDLLQEIRDLRTRLLRYEAMDT